MEQNTSLEILTQSGEDIVISGQPLTIRAIKLSALPKVTTAVGDIAKDVFALFAPDNGIVFEKGKDIEISQDGWLLIHRAIENNIQSIVTILAAYTRQPREWFLDEETGIDIEDTALLLLAIVEKHYSFFTKRLAPVVDKLKANQEKQ